MTMPEMIVARENSLRLHEEETLKETRLQSEPILIQVTPDSTL